MQVAWWPHTTNRAIASYRLRCAQVVDQLQRNGVDAGLYRRGAMAEVLVLSKRYDSGSLELAIAMRKRHGTRLVLDLCDNHFYAASDTAQWQQRTTALQSAVRAVDLVVASSEALASVIRQEVAGARVCVIGDAPEPPFFPSPWHRLVHPAPEIELAALESKLTRGQARKGRRLVWFGNHGSDYADGGMLDLGVVRSLLEACHDDSPLSLTIISNSREKFDMLSSSWTVPLNYLSWHRSTFSRALRLHDVALIPIGRNPFTICKTNNRAATSLLHGLGVVADTIPSYESLADCIVLDDWDDGLRRLMTDSSYRQGCVDRGARRVREQQSVERIAAQWLAALALR